MYDSLANKIAAFVLVYDQNTTKSAKIILMIIVKVCMFFLFVQKQGSKMRHTIKELEDKLTIASEKWEEMERVVSLF